MGTKSDGAEPPQRVALVAQDQKKDQMVEWVSAHAQTFRGIEFFGTGTTGSRIEKQTGLCITKLKSGLLGGVAQIGTIISEVKLDTPIFFVDPLSALPHDVDVKSLLRLTTLYNIELAINEATAAKVIA